MVTLLCPDSTPAPRPVSYISVVWLKLGMAMAGATTALETVRFTAWLASLVPVSLEFAGTNVTYPVVPLGPCCWGVTLATGTLAPAPPALELAPGSWMVRVPGTVWASTGARLTPDTSFMGPAGTANRVLGGPTAAGTVGT